MISIYVFTFDFRPLIKTFLCRQMADMRISEVSKLIDTHHPFVQLCLPSGLATSSFAAFPNRSCAEIRRLYCVRRKSCADKTLLMTWVDITKAKYRRISVRVEQRTSTIRNYRRLLLLQRWNTRSRYEHFLLHSGTASDLPSDCS